MEIKNIDDLLEYELGDGDIVIFNIMGEKIVYEIDNSTLRFYFNKKYKCLFFLIREYIEQIAYRSCGYRINEDECHLYGASTYCLTFKDFNSISKTIFNIYKFLEGEPIALFEKNETVKDYKKAKTGKIILAKKQIEIKIKNIYKDIKQRKKKQIVFILKIIFIPILVIIIIKILLHFR